MFEIFLVIAGLATLLVGGELLLRGATKIAAFFGMSNLMIGLTIVSLGTSAPEAAICIDAALSGNAEIALGNIIGSNIANVLLILGLTAVIIPIVVHRKIIQREIPIMIACSLLFLLVVLDGELSRIDGMILLTGMITFFVWQFLSSMEEPDLNQENQEPESADPDANSESGSGFIFSIIFILLGMGMLWFGAGWLVQGATSLASSFGVSELVIGLTVVAIGSSAPEIVTSLMAAKRGFPEMAIGNVVGSNIANLLLVGGTTAVISKNIVVPAPAMEFDIPFMIVASLACLPILATGHKISRWEGALFLCCFILFTVFLFFRAEVTVVFPKWSMFVWPVATPLILATVYVLITNWLKKNN
ncbi:MAG: calcium/sodium antiporter [Mariniblastus sp.]